MKPWEERPQEVANLLNPAFCGRVIYESIKGYEENGKAMQYPLCFLVLPIVLHPPTRATMSGRTRHFQVWLNSNQQIKIDLAIRARSLVPYAREAVTFLLQTETLIISGPAVLLTINKALKKKRRTGPESQDHADCIRAADVLGKWLSRIDSPSTVYASLGLMP